MYGIRQYTEGAILSPHADRNPLISSCIINVAQDVGKCILLIFDTAGMHLQLTHVLSI